MTKYLCIDFDGTLTDPKVSAYVKKISDFLQSHSEENVKIGIVTARSISDDFKTYGQFYNEITMLLDDQQIRLDFICTRYCLHLINPMHYTSHSISGAIQQAQLVPIFGETHVNYLSYRSEHQATIAALRNPGDNEHSYHELSSHLFQQTQIQREQEQTLYNAHIKGKMVGNDTPKINQIKKIITSYPGQDDSVLLLDDAAKHIRAVNGHSESNWQGVFYNGDDIDVELKLSNFIGNGFLNAQSHEEIPVLTNNTGGYSAFFKPKIAQVETTTKSLILDLNRVQLSYR